MATTTAPAGVTSQARRAPRGTWSRLRRRGSQAAFFAAVLVVWIGVRRLDLLPELALPDPVAVAGEFADLVTTAAYWTAIGETLRSAVFGLGAAILVGVPVGLVLGTYPLADRSTRVVVEVGRSFPVIAVLPVLLLVLGANLQTKGTVVFLACVFPLIIQAQYGARSLSAAIEETVRSYRIPRLLRFRKVVLPAAAPSVMTGLRLTSTMAVLVSIGVEILTPVPGIGGEIVQGQLDGNSPVAYAYILTASVIGYSINQLSQVSEARLLAWRPPADLDD
ncbi:ABC transporter permease subunit [Pseudonocardia nematodicida]|uniref:ABC transporter permease subunit n=1 Tax=Pseudonocardia nematodicida TaxID=1206997 RepID=A0ABV1KFN2_9PSEU